MAMKSATQRVKIRPARSKDAARLAELSSQLGYPSTAVETLQRMRKLKPASLNALFVAEDRDAVVVG